MVARETAPRPPFRPEEAGLDRLRPHCGSMLNEMPEAAIRQDEGGVVASGIETAEVSC